ncbi:copper homeostasis protein CutC [Sphingomonas sp. BT553]|uniref:PF03932 family protein CutC n=1 Tax=Sphingomonas mollis TaxID=2795726 RepID=A0ABS0XNQ7_9SPHN|nr:copper homeostasis protein CutC [Sphingomonas sp. BT553]
MRLEVCVEDLAGIDAAIAGGADRIELCSALSVGGLTPAGSLIRAVADVPLPVHLLCRPRAGGFIYTTAEQTLVADDIRTAAEAGLAGAVIGANDPVGHLDTSLLAEWVALARSLAVDRGRPLSLTLHRAFDLCPDLTKALDEAIELGFDRILTSGGTPKAIDGIATLADLHRRAAGRIGILPGSGIDPTTLPAILATGVDEVHASCRRPIAERAGEMTERRFGFVADPNMATDAGAVATLKAMLRAHE